MYFAAFWQYSSASSGSPFARRKVELWKKLQRFLMGRSMAHRKRVWWLRSSMKIRLETAMWKRLMPRRLATRNSACRIVFEMSSSVRPESWTSEAYLIQLVLLYIILNKGHVCHVIKCGWRQGKMNVATSTCLNILCLRGTTL